MKQLKELYEKMIAKLLTSPQSEKDPTPAEYALLLVLIAFLVFVMLDSTNACQLRLLAGQQYLSVAIVFWMVVIGGLWVAAPRLIFKATALALYWRSFFSR